MLLLRRQRMSLLLRRVRTVDSWFLGGWWRWLLWLLGSGLLVVMDGTLHGGMLDLTNGIA